MIYSCTTTDGPAGYNDICAAGAWNGLVFTFDETNRALYPPGTYTVDIVGTVGSKTISTPITVILVDPCDSVAMQEPILSNLSYTITDFDLNEPLEPPFEAVPSSCESSATLIAPAELTEYAWIDIDE